jgi:hypothetical protein
LFTFLSLGRIKSDNSLISFWCFGYFFETFLIDVWFDPPSIKKIEASSTKNEGQMEYWSSFEIQEFPWAIQMRRSGGGAVIGKGCIEKCRHVLDHRTALSRPSLFIPA